MSAQDPKPKYRDVRDLVVTRWKADIIRSSRGPNDPNVWSGRALQENFVELAESGLASMYPAFCWSVGSWPSWISARMRPH
jgi:hypothetical protein